MPTRRFRCYCLLAVLITAGCAVPPEPVEPVLPLSAAEQEAVIAEIEKMVQTDVHKVKEFVVVEATPERIERLYHTPEFLQQPTVVRENGLIFASKGRLMTFDKPSDVINKVSAWFPEEVAKARAEGSDLRSSDVHLWGAHLAGWELEPIAFVALWRCMPNLAWLRPERNPFETRLAYSLPMLPIGAMSSSEQEFDFGFCVRNRNRVNWGLSLEQHAAIKDEIRDVGNRITPTLRAKFARYLSENRCEGSGPDDCVMVLRLWAGLTPDDPELAAMLQSLEAEVDPDGPLPEMEDPDADPWRSPREIGEARYDEGRRKLAFLRSKLVSVLNASQAWPADALQGTLRQMTNLGQAFVGTYVRRWSRYGIDSHKDPISPWRVLQSVPELIPSVRRAVLAEVERLDPATDCAVYDYWFDHEGPILETTYAMRRLEAQQEVRCGYLDFAWMRNGETVEAINLRERFVALTENSAPLRDDMLTIFTDQAGVCFADEQDSVPAWLRELCDTWISEPQYVGFTLEHSQLTLDDVEQFYATEHKPPEEWEAEDVSERQDRWLATLVPDSSVAATELDAYAAVLRQRKQRVLRAKVWRHPGRANWLLDLQVTGDEYGYVVLAAGPGGLTAVDIPPRFKGRYAEYDIVRVSDLDADGNLELWVTDSYDFSYCQGDASDLERDVYCTAQAANMGEIRDDVLSYFLKSPASPEMRVSTIAEVPAPPVTELAGERRNCNDMLIGSVLGDRLPDLVFGNDGNVFGLICKPHPQRPEQTLVSMFHHLEESDDEKGFAFAVIDAENRRAIGLFRDTIQQDAAIRISNTSLSFDPDTYELAPGDPALGVRLNIGDSLNCAEGGESDYLRLFVDNGDAFEMVVMDLPMSRWRITDGMPRCGGSTRAYTVENVSLQISALSTVTEGWYDLEVKAHYRVESFDADEWTPATSREESRVLGVLRASGGVYPIQPILQRLRQ